MRRYKHTTQHPSKLPRAINGQNIGKIRAKLGEIIQTINIAILLLMILVVITQCQPVEASNKIGNKPLFYATKQAIRGNYQKACIPCQSRGGACNKHQLMQQNLCKMHQKMHQRRNKPRFHAPKRAVLGNYQKGCIPCQSRDRACNKHQFTHQNLCKMHQKTLESNHQK